MKREQSAYQLLVAANPVPPEDDFSEALGHIRSRVQTDRVAPRSAALRSKRAVRGALAIAVLAAVVAVAAPALGVLLPALDFFGAEPAPAPIAKQFESLREGSPPGMDTSVISHQTRLVMNRQLGDLEHRLWVAPTATGGFCTLWEGVYGGCDRFGALPLSVNWGQSRTPSFVSGHVSSRYADAVEVLLTGGKKVRPDVTWVSHPINAGFFAHEFESSATVEAVIALDVNGSPVATLYANPRLHQYRVHPDAITADAQVVLKAAGDAGSGSIWVAPTRYEGSCAWLAVRAHEMHIGCWPRSQARGGNALGFLATERDVLLWAKLGEGAEAVRIRFADGHIAQTRQAEGFALYLVPRDRLEERRLPERVIVADATGQAIVDMPVTAQGLCVNSPTGSCPVRIVGALAERGEGLQSAQAVCAAYARNISTLDLSGNSLADLAPPLRDAARFSSEQTLALRQVATAEGLTDRYREFLHLHESRDVKLRLLATLAQQQQSQPFNALATRLAQDLDDLAGFARDLGLEGCAEAYAYGLPIGS